MTVLLSAVVATGAQQVPPRDAAPAPTIGTASISGVVVNDEDKPQPVRRAIVTLTGDGLRPSRGAITDDDGRFTIGSLPAGRFTVTASRASFITSMYGAKRPGRAGTPIAVAAGARVADLVVRIWRGAAVAGVLRDDTGAPVGHVEVRAVPARATTAALFTLSNNGAMTNDQGEYRIFGLEPGTYVVSARPPAGGASPIVAMSEAEVDAAIAALRTRGGTGAAPPPSVPAAPPPPAQQPFDFAPVYYPGTPVLAQAAPIVLAAGQEQRGLDFALQRVPTAVVEGFIRRPDGTPAGGASVQMTSAAPSGPFSSGSRLEINATSAADGSFRVAQVTPGTYQLVARAAAQSGAPTGVSGGLVTPGPTGPQLWAATDLSITGADVKGLALTLASGVTFSGRLAFDSDTLKPPADLTRVRIFVAPASMFPIKPGTPVTTILFTPPVTARADGTFELPNVGPGRYLLFINGPGLDGTAWRPRSAMQGDRDLFDDVLDVGTGPSTIVATFTDRRSQLSGMLQTANGAPASDVFVIAFAADRRNWTATSRRVKAVRPAVDGRFVIDDLPAGDYLLAAVTDVDQDEWTNPAFLEQLVAGAVKVSIAYGETRVQDLRIGR